MKNLFLATLLSFLGVNTPQAQNMNWKWADNHHPHYTHINLGYDFGFTTRIGHSYLTPTEKPVLFTLDYSFPMGNQLFDDYKLRLGGHVQALEYNNFILSVKALGNFKRHQTDLVRMLNFGIETSTLVGYYKPKWHIAGELGLIKPFSSHLSHSEIMRESFPSIVDGWYTAAGGYYFYGLQAGKSISRGLDISLRIGSNKAMGDNKDAIIAKYAQVGILKKF